MLNRIFITLTAAFLMSLGLKAQHAALPLTKASDYNFYKDVVRQKASLPPVNKTLNHVVVGWTNFDLQTHGSERMRIARLPNDSSAIVWSEDQSGDIQFPGRGTGYERYGGGSTIAFTDTILETSVRTGFPNILLLADSSEVVINHTGTGPLFMLKRNAMSGGPWTGTNLPYDTNITALLWPMAAVGNNDSMSIHVIALSEPTNSGGQTYGGLDGALLYYRSTDGGTTWNIQDSILSGLDNTQFTGFEPDGYSITARDSVIAIGIFDVAADVLVLKSIDNGNTWTSTIVNDFPFIKYVADQPGGTDINNDQQIDTILTSDGAGSLLIDANGKVHAWYGELHIYDKDLSDGLIKYLPTSSGLHYWNENMGADTSAVIADLIDKDASGSFNFTTKIAQYQKSLTSFPTSCAASNNQIHVFYSALVEDQSWQSEQYRHIYTISSEDGGNTWNQPEDLTAGLGYNECVHPSSVKYADTSLFITFQEDPLPGLATFGDLDPLTKNNQVTLYLDTTELVSVNQIKNPGQELVIYPNPAKDQVKISVPGAEGKLTIEIYSIEGQMLQSIQHANGHVLHIHSLPTGVYILNTRTESTTITTRLFKQ